MMTIFNLDGGAVKAKTQLGKIAAGMDYYEFVGKSIPEPLTIDAKDFDLLIGKAATHLKKVGEPYRDIVLRYRGVRLCRVGTQETSA